MLQAFYFLVTVADCVNRIQNCIDDGDEVSRKEWIVLNGKEAKIVMAHIEFCRKVDMSIYQKKLRVLILAFLGMIMKSTNPDLFQ